MIRHYALEMLFGLFFALAAAAAAFTLATSTGGFIYHGF
jgi:hypothetical protein